MNCQNCGQPVAAGAAFCGNCGVAVQQLQTSQINQTTQSRQPEITVIQENPLTQNASINNAPVPQSAAQASAPVATDYQPVPQAMAPAAYSQPVAGQTNLVHAVSPEIEQSKNVVGWVAIVYGVLNILAVFYLYTTFYNDVFAEDDKAALTFGIVVAGAISLAILYLGVSIKQANQIDSIKSKNKILLILAGVIIGLSVIGGQGVGGIFTIVLLVVAIQLQIKLNKV